MSTTNLWWPHFLQSVCAEEPESDPEKKKLKTPKSASEETEQNTSLPSVEKRPETNVFVDISSSYEKTRPSEPCAKKPKTSVSGEERSRSPSPLKDEERHGKLYISSPVELDNIFNGHHISRFFEFVRFLETLEYYAYYRNDKDLPHS